ncbi:FkbM family methyltransferase [Pollutimonas bauzanensis]|uniref:Methyltransferase, FkbM family n=1 Tax=Pollutimonas bauzanensis TaxID=658167 RepID=A0A1M6BKA1_9BURK|nr:FkbM family methyltransferase [Pollutimonas bauzanensis]SHI49149.1 methyltransferase, FkbM family [Pollutimonas bauzanensis]
MFISYAQNFEDVMLWRALKHIERGFYIDIGAQDPVIDSISRAFYEHGWRGIHVEPTEQYSKKLKDARPDEIVEQVAIGNGDTTLEFFEFSDTGLSTADAAIALQHQSAGYHASRTEVPVISMDLLLDKYSDKTIHWLKIDVEGYEKNVIESWSYSNVRPWILIIESTKPLTQQQSHLEWDYLIVDKGYVFVYFDGLNRFYIHKDKIDLKNSFDRPPNIFDGFTLSGSASQPFYQNMQNRIKKAKVMERQAEAKTHHAEVRAQQAEVRAQQAEHILEGICTSSSWRLTAPLRWIGRQLRLLRLHGIRPRLKKLTKIIFLPIFRRIDRFLIAHPVCRSRCLMFLSRIGLYGFLHSVYVRLLGSREWQAIVPRERPPLELQHLTPRARDIYKALKGACRSEKGG